MTQPVPPERTREDMATVYGYDLGYKDAAKDIADALRAKAQQVRDSAWAKHAVIVDECVAVALKIGGGGLR